jgi:hypothetical protein
MTEPIKAAENYCMYCNGRGFFRDDLSGGESYCMCEAGRRLREFDRAKVGSAVYCGHANEMPQVCPCPPNCYCKAHSCSKAERKTAGRILYPQPDTPQRLIRELLNLATERCVVCRKLATRSATMKLIWSDPSYFCDEHTLKDVRRFEDAEAEYQDLEHAPLLRRCLKWLEENKVEEKTGGGVW